MLSWGKPVIRATSSVVQQQKHGALTKSILPKPDPFIDALWLANRLLLLILLIVRNESQLYCNTPFMIVKDTAQTILQLQPHDL